MSDLKDKVIFKDNDKYYYINGEDIIGYATYNAYNNAMVKGVDHLDDVVPLKYYKNVETNNILPVYFEHNDNFITKVRNVYSWIMLKENMIPYYTIKNLKLLEDGDII